MQVQMLLSERKKMFFCIASLTFEETREVFIYIIDFNREECLEIME